MSRRLPDGRTPRQTLDDANGRVLDLYRSQMELWDEQLRPALAEEGIVVSGVEELEPDERAELDDRFEREIFPGADPPCRRPRTAVPLHLRALDQPRPVRRPTPRPARSDLPG